MLAGRILAGAAAVLVSAGACAARPYNPDHLSAGAIGRVSAVCLNVMGLSRGKEHFDNCVESLSDAQQGLAQAGALAQAQRQCRDRGLEADSLGLAQCELERSRQAAATPTTSIPSQTPEPVSRTSYFLAAPREVYSREELSCARLGLEPGGGAYQGCVARLQSAVSSAGILAQ